MRHVTIEREGSGTADVVFLSRRESQVLWLVCEGRSDKEIAGRLRVAVGTVKSHMRGLLHSLGMKSRMELAIWGMQNPSAMQPGRAANRKLHRPGCDCPAIYCTAMRLATREIQSSAA